MKSILLFLFGILFSLFSFGKVKQDSIIIKGSFQGDFNVSKVSLFAYNKKVPIVEKNISGKSFSFSLSEKIEPGVYYLQYINEKSIKTDFIIDNNEKTICVELKKGNFFYQPLPIFKESVINIKWYEYLNQTQIRVARLNNLFDFFALFPSQLDNKILRYYQKERRQYYKIFSNFVKNNSDNWAGLIVANNPYYFSNLRKKPVVRDFLRHDYYWEGIDTNNPKLINTPLYTEQINNYLNYVYDISKHHPFSEDEMQKEFKRSADVVFERFSKNNDTKQFALNCLVDFFVLKNNKELLSYISEKKH